MPRSTRGATRAPGSRAGAGGATRRATRPSATPRGGAPCTPKTRASRSARETLRSPRSRRADPASMRTKRPIAGFAFRLQTGRRGKPRDRPNFPCAPPVPVWNWLRALGTLWREREAKNRDFWDARSNRMANSLGFCEWFVPQRAFSFELRETNASRFAIREQSNRETASPPPISSSACHLARSEDTPSDSPGKWVFFSRRECARKVPRAARGAPLPHTPHLPPVIMASSLATHQFAGVNAQLKCVPRLLSDANTGSHIARRTCREAQNQP